MRRIAPNLYVTIKPSATSGVTLSYLFTQKSS